MAVVTKFCAADVPPPGAGLVTVTGKVPTVAISEAGITAVSWLADTNVVVRAEPFQLTTEEATKLDPFTVKVKPEVPAIVVVGEIVVKVGTGLFLIASWKSPKLAKPVACVLVVPLLPTVG